jgi:hypothetical protein
VVDWLLGSHETMMAAWMSPRAPTRTWRSSDS